MQRIPIGPFAASAILLLALGARAAAPPVLDPGTWMYAIDTTTNGKPEPQRTGEECLGDQLKDLGAFFAPKVEGADTNCKTTRKGSSGNTIDYRLQCAGGGFTMDGITSVTIQDSRRVTIRSRIDMRTMTAEAHMVSTGEALRTGPCRR